MSLKHLAPPPLASKIIEPCSPTALPPHQHASPRHYVTTPCDPHQLKPLDSDPLINEFSTLVEPKAPLRVSSRRVDRIDYKALNDGKGVIKKDI